MRLLILSTLAMLLSTPLLAQDQSGTLADIRQELTLLYGEVRALGLELNTTGLPAGTAQAGSTLDRINAIEQALQGLTARTEQLELRIARIVRDGTNQIGDLEFRLCELEPSCDVASLGDTPMLGGDAPNDPAQTDSIGGEVTPRAEARSDQTQAPQLAVGERRDFDLAQEALAAGEYQSAARGFAAFVATYPGSPLSGAAELGRGEALEALGDLREAARAYLAAFSANPAAGSAPDALFHLGAALGQIGKTNEACVTLGEVAVRYPSAAITVSEAQERMLALDCSG